MLLNNVVRDRNERLMGALPTLDLWLAAKSLDPFVGAGGGIARPSRPSVLPADGKHVGATNEQSSKKRHLFSCRGTGRYAWRTRDHCGAMVGVHKRCPLALKLAKRGVKFCPFGVQRGQPRPNAGNLFVNFAIIHLCGLHELLHVRGQLSRSGPPLGHPRREAATPSQPETELPAQIPFDATVAAHDASDVSAEALVKDRLPRHQAEAEPVFDHGEASAGEIG